MPWPRCSMQHINIPEPTRTFTMNCDSVFLRGSFQAFHVVAESQYERLYSVGTARSTGKALLWAIYQKTDFSQCPPPKKKQAPWNLQSSHYWLVKYIANGNSCLKFQHVGRLHLSTKKKRLQTNIWKNGETGLFPDIIALKPTSHRMELHAGKSFFLQIQSC